MNSRRCLKTISRGALAHDSLRKKPDASAFRLIWRWINAGFDTKPRTAPTIFAVATWPMCALALLGAALGCGGGGDRPEIVPVSGRVLYQGEPVAGARVSFINDSAPRVASGKTDAEGQYRLTTFDQHDGAIPGEHLVTVLKLPGDEQSDGPVDAAAANPLETADYAGKAVWADEVPNLSLLPKKYADRQTTDLKVQVAADGANTIDLDLEE